jgi:uncharacterized SAM-binding protein YcdF (DUF218 family)
MLFWPKKIIALLFLPLSFALIAGLTGLVLLHLRRRERLARLLITASLLALAFFSNKGVASLLLAPLENRHAAVPELSPGDTLPAELAACRFVAVLGGGHGESDGFSRINQLSPAALGRLAEAIRILRLLPEDARLIVSGHAGEDKTTHAQVLAEAALSLGVPPARILRLDTPRDTEDEARAILARVGQAPVAVVTSAWHMPRAVALCRGAGLQTVPCPADFLLKPGADTGLRLLQFDLGALERSTKAIREYLGLVWASLRGQT